MDEDRPIFTLTVDDFDLSLEAHGKDAKGVARLGFSPEMRAEILERVRKSVGWAEWTEDFHRIVGESIEAVLNGDA